MKTDEARAGELLDRYRTASDWTLSKIAGAADQLDSPTPCDGWDVATLLNHMLETQQYFLDHALGHPAVAPSPEPPTDLIGANPAAAYERNRALLLRTFSEPDAMERTGPSLAIAFSDTLLHGWDLATATGQSTTMPDGLARAAYEIVHGAFTDEQRVGTFGPEIAVHRRASPQTKFLAYTGRDPG